MKYNVEKIPKFISTNLAITTFCVSPEQDKPMRKRFSFGISKIKIMALTKYLNLILKPTLHQCVIPV